MDFDISPAEREFDEHIRTVFDSKIGPEYPSWRSENTTPRRMFELLGEAGLLGFTLKNGTAAPLPWLWNIHYYKRAAQFSGGVAIASFAHAQLANQALFSFGDARQQAEFLFDGIRGQRILAFANTEPGAGSDAARIALRAEERDGGFLVNGTKSYITNADIADQIVFTAVTDPGAAKPHRGISMFVVDGETAGLGRRRLRKYGWIPSHLSTLNFRDVFIPYENRVGEPGRGFYQTMEVFNASRIGIAALAFGTALGAYRLAYRHAIRRSAFGKPLFEHESKKNEFAENLASLEAAWLLVQKTAFVKDAGREFRYQASMAKLFATEEALRISQWATETLGARGVLETHPCAEYPHDAKLAMIGEGAPEVQKKIIAENVAERLDAF